MGTQHLCDQHHGYDTGIFDAVVRSLLATTGSKSKHSGPEPVDNFFTVVIVWFLVGVVLVLVIGVVLLAVLGTISESEDESEDGRFSDLEKQVSLGE